MRTTANAFGLAVSTVSIIVKNVTQAAISTHLASTYIKLPISEQDVQPSAANVFALSPVLRYSGWYTHSDTKTK
jgi:hypothetical protein